MYMQRWRGSGVCAVCVGGMGVLMLAVVGLAAPPDGTKPEQAATIIEGLDLPFSGQGSIWILDDGWLLIRFERSGHPAVPADPVRVSQGNAGGVGLGGNVHSPAHPAAEVQGRRGGAVGVGGGKATTGPRIVPLRLTTQRLVLAGDGRTWHLQSKPPSEVERQTVKPEVIAVAPRDGPCRRHSLLDLTGSLHLQVDPAGNMHLDARDDNTGRRLLAILRPVPASEIASREIVEDDAVVHLSCNITCDNQTSCSVSISCDPEPGCWVICFCDANGNATCLSGHGQMPGVSVPD